MQQAARGSRGRLLALCQAQEIEERADVVAFLRGVSEHRRLSVDYIAVAATLPLPLDVAGLDEVGQDALRGAEGDADRVSDVTQADIGVAGDAEQHLRVVRNELPAPIGLAG